MQSRVSIVAERILSDVDYKTSRDNLFVVAISIGFAER